MSLVVTILLLIPTGVAAITGNVGAPLVTALLTSNSWFTTLQRSRFAALTGVRLTPQPAWLRGPYEDEQLAAEVRAESTQRQFAYHLISGIFGPAAAAVVLGLWLGGAFLATMVLKTGFHSSLPVSLVANLVPLGIAAIFAAPWAATGLVRADVAAARALLEPDHWGRMSRLRHEVQTLTESRAGIVDAADAERRRIERDLHDGAQQRLVSLAINLGVARTATASDTPEPVRAAIAHAHDEAIQALSELRDFIRGLHPAVLDELGLDAALSGIAAKSPVPVSVSVDLPHRPPRNVESVMYFAVSEALTNCAKHARATCATIRVDHLNDSAGHRIRLLVSDDGCGGADEGGGSGLHGLRQRVSSLDGTFSIDSPRGGPTLITAELSCEW